ncbi:MAG: hypothetical protein N4A41_14295 [Crocinitomicaceae bacterium]|nr:hypothetical protein [Crocinitomicaceae bacterium]
MNWTAITSIFFLSTFKFMFAPFAGAGLSLSFVETALTCFIGASISSAFFYFSSSFLMKRHHEKMVAKGTTIARTPAELKKAIRKRKFNRYIVKLKWTFGQYGICFIGPLFLSVPIGSIICAKFYNHKSNNFFIVLFCLACNSLLLTTLAIFIF